MQTFLPYASYKLSADKLDNKRLWKQCVETKQLVIAQIMTTQHSYHPACRMWIGHRDALCHYGMAMCVEHTNRGYNDGDLWNWFYMKCDGPLIYPPWFGSYHFHSDHRANLMRKNPGHYQFSEHAKKGYFWPGPTYDWRNVPSDLYDPLSKRLLGE